MVIASALATSVAVHLPPASAAATDHHAGMTQQSGACHNQAEDSIPAAAKLPACCLVYCSSCSSIPAAPSAPARPIAFVAQTFVAETASQPAGHDIHPDPHPPRV
jgi:hypothetical protein